MKTFQKLLTNSLLFAENRLCHGTGAEKQEAPQAQPEGRFSPGQKVEGFNLPKDKEVKVKEGKAGNDGKPELITGVALLVNAEGNDQGQLVAVEREWRDAEGKVIFKKGEYLRRHEGDSYRENGEDVTGQFADYIKSELIEKSKAIGDIEAKKTEAKSDLEEQKKKALEELPKTATDEAKAAVEEEYKKTSDKIDEEEKKTKDKIDSVSAEEKIEKTTADSLAKEFDVEIKKLTKEGGEKMDNEAEIKGKLKDPAQLEEWLKNAKNRAYMRQNILEEANGKHIVNFKKLQRALNLSDNEYKIAERNLRIGNLLENGMIEKITSVKTKGKEMVAKYFYEGGEKVKGVYTEKNKYIPIWNGTEISFGTENLEFVKADNKDFEKKIAKVKASAPAEGGAKAEGAEPAPGTLEAAAKAKAEATAATSPESRTAQGLDSTPVKPLEPTESKDVAGAKEFNGIISKPNGSNFDIIDASTKKVTNTVDADTLAVLEGREIPTEEWMKKVIAEKFPYLQGAVTYGLEEDDGGNKEIVAKFGDGQNNFEAIYGVEVNSRRIIRINGNITQFLKDTKPETIAQFYLDAKRMGGKENFEEKSVTDELSKKLVNEDWVGAAEILAEQPNPDPKTLAVIVYRADTLSKVNTDKLQILKSKIGAKRVIQIWKENGYDDLYINTILKLELLNGEGLNMDLQDAVMDCGLGSGGETNQNAAAFYNKYKSNPKVAEWYLKEGAETGANLLLLVKDYAGELGDEVAIKLTDSYSEIDSLSLKDDEKTALKEKCKKIFTNYLTAHAKDESPAKYQEIYTIIYGDDTTKLPDGASKPSPEVYAKNFILAIQNPFEAGVFDGAGWLAFDSQETNKYISAYLDEMTTIPMPSIPKEQPDPAKEKSVASIIMELAKQSKNSLAQTFAAGIEFYSFSLVEGRDPNRLEEVKNLKKIAENTKDQNALTAIDALKQLRGNVEEMLKTEAGRTALGFENKDKFDTWLGKQKALIQFEAGDFGNIDEDQLDDSAQKEVVRVFRDPKDYIKSIAQIHRTAKVVSPESLKKLSEEEFVFGWKSIEIYLALGLKGKAKEVADGMTDEVEKNYYLSLFAETKEDKLALLEKAISEVVPKKEENLTAADLELRAKILKELKNAEKMPDQYKYKGVNASILESLAGIPMASNPDKKDFYNAVLDIKLLNAETEIAQCEDPSNPFASDHDGACDYKELVNEVKAYNESLPEGQEMDKAMLERLHVLIGTNTDLLKDEDAKKAYASLMVKIDKAEGLEKYITQDAKYLESKGKFLEAAKLITDTPTPENLSKKKELLAKALTATGEDAGKKAEIAAEYATLDEQESQEKAVEIYLSTKKHYDKAIDLMEDSSNKISIGFIKSKLNVLMNPEVDLADDAEEICLGRGSMQKELIKIYREKKDKKSTKVELALLLNSAADDPSLNEPIFELLNDDDKRKEKDFAEVTSEAKKVFCLAIKDKLTTDTVKNRIKGKLGITQDMDAFLKGEEATGQPADTTPEALTTVSEWIEKEITQERYDRAMASLKKFNLYPANPALAVDVTPPALDKVKTILIAQLKPGQLEVIKQMENPVLLLQPKVQSARYVKAINSYKPIKVDAGNQEDAYISDWMNGILTARDTADNLSNQVAISGWKVSIVEGAQEPKMLTGDDASKTLKERTEWFNKAYKNKANGITAGEYTLLQMQAMSENPPKVLNDLAEENGTWTIINGEPAKDGMVAGGFWYGGYRQIFLSERDLDHRYDNARFRASVVADVQ